MIKKMILSLVVLFFSVSAFANPNEIQPTYMWFDGPANNTGMYSNLGFGILNSDFVTGSGTSIFFDAGTTYAINKNLGLGLNIPLAGTLSSNDDGFGLGNISLSAKYFFDTNSSLVMGVGSEFAFASATSDASIGAFTRHFYRYAQDQWAVVPGAVFGYQQDGVQLLGHIGAPIQLFNDDGQFEGDRMETSLSYDIGASVATSSQQTLWITAEAGGYSTLTYDSVDNQTELFGRIGAQYQNDEMAFGASLAVPFTESMRDVHSIMFFGNFSYRFQ